MLLKNLIKIIPKNFDKIKVSNLALDSRKVKKGHLFFALKGNKYNGEDFIEHAIKKGASAIICSNKAKLKKYNIPIIKVKNPQKALAYSCALFFKKKPKNIIAVTGTNGKSSVADFFYQILFLNKILVASIGTLGIKENKKIKKIGLTSPDIISLHKELVRLKKNKIDNVIIEASSHGLKQGRLDGIRFIAGIFTNFTQDHLDYHKTMSKYFEAKKILFTDLLKNNKYMITDSDQSKFLELKKIAKKNKLKLLTIDSVFKNKKNKIFPLIGTFQKKNLLMSVLAAKICGLKLSNIEKILNKLSCVSGRMELVRTLPNKSKVYIDYAHTPDALLTVLKSLKKYYKENLTLVFGCGGNRDFKKRPLMASIAKQNCKKIIVTDDNPRFENPKKIRSSIIKRLKKHNYIEEGNRAKAIELALNNTEENEVVLIAGKGHEVDQDYGNKLVKISDKEIIKNIKIKKKNNSENLDYEFNSKILNEVLKNNFYYKFKGVSINSKKVEKNNLFIAIKGKAKDGHQYVSEAFKKKASYCAVSKKISNINKKKLITIKNTNSFLKKLAVRKRANTKATIIAVTGSCGKTTVKTLLGNFLKTVNRTYYSTKSYNNHYGVPLSLSNLERTHNYGVFEIGMSKKGEINKLSKLVKPDIALITNIAEAHIENFKNLQSIAVAKSEIINNINKSGCLIINRDQKFFNYFKNLALKRKIEIISFGKSSYSDVRLISVKQFQNKKIAKIKVFNETLFIESGNTNIENLLSIMAVLKFLNIDLKKTVDFFKSFKLIEGRGRVYDIERYSTNFKLIDESYNANPLSVKNAIINFSNIKKKNFKKYLLLGDMLELGKKSNLYHQNLSKIINKTDIDKVFVYGDKVLNTFKYTKKNKQGNILQYINDFDEVFSALVKKNDHILIKGSNATGLNKLSKNIIRGKSYAI